jgi:putative tRNA adenosine deaminase-associated protein
VAYFTAVLSPEGSGDDRDWRTVEIDLEAGSPDELGDALRGAVDDDDAPVLAVLEREDEWFALVRTDGALDVRVFVSDAVAAADSAYAPLFAELPSAAAVTAAADGGPDDGSGGSGVDDDDDQPEPEEDEVPAARSETGVLEDVWAGDPELLADLGCPAEVLVRLAGSGADPSAATVEIGEVLGFADVLESLR